MNFEQIMDKSMILTINTRLPWNWVAATHQLPDKLNAVYAHFERENSNVPSQAPTSSDDTVYSSTVVNIRRSFLRVNPLKASCIDGIPGCIFKTCTDQLAAVFRDIFNLTTTVHDTQWH